jgi:hypothetical protein
VREASLLDGATRFLVKVVADECNLAAKEAPSDGGFDSFGESLRCLVLPFPLLDEDCSISSVHFGPGSNHSHNDKWINLQRGT